MPGAPHMGRGKPMAARSTAEVIGVFLVLPVAAGVALLWFTMANAVAHAPRFTAADWFWQVGWAGLLGVGLLTALPAAGWRELRRRKGPGGTT